MQKTKLASRGWRHRGGERAQKKLSIRCNLFTSQIGKANDQQPNNQISQYKILSIPRSEPMRNSKGHREKEIQLPAGDESREIRGPRNFTLEYYSWSYL